MKNIVYTLAILLCSSYIIAQSNDITIDKLKAPQSPAANLLGMADSEISKPTDPTAFMLSLRQATNNFTSLPTNYAVDFSPFQVFGSKKLKFTDWLEGRNSFKQNTVLSIAVNNNPVLNQNNELAPNTALGFGFKISLFGGNLSEKAKSKMDSSIVFLSEITKTLLADSAAIPTILYREGLLKYADSESKKFNTAKRDAYILLQNESLKIISEKNFSSKKLMIQEHGDSIKSLIQQVDLNRYGWKWNVEGAIAYNFPQTSIKNNEFSKLGLWTTFGYEFEKGFSILGLGRYFYSPNEAITIIDSTAINGFDTGIRMIYEKNDFTFSGEIIYRNGTLDMEVGDKSKINTYKYQLNFSYHIAANAQLTLNLGRQFDGTLNNTGNLISALNFIKGFGRKAELVDKTGL